MTDTGTLYVCRNRLAITGYAHLSTLQFRYVCAIVGGIITYIFKSWVADR